MTISAEQRQVLLDRLAKAREAKDAKKASAPPKEPKAKTAKKTKAPEQSSLPSQPQVTASSPPATEAESVLVRKANETSGASLNVSITEKPIASPPSTPSLPIPIPPSKSRKEKPVAEEDESDDAGLSQKQKAQKKAYAKVVFYQQPSAKKMDKMMKQLAHETSESESESEDEAPAPPVRQRPQSPPPVAYSTLAPQRQPVRRQQPYNIQTQSQQRTDYLRQLALAYYS